MIPPSTKEAILSALSSFDEVRDQPDWKDWEKKNYKFALEYQGRR